MISFFLEMLRPEIITNAIDEVADEDRKIELLEKGICPKSLGKLDTIYERGYVKYHRCYKSKMLYRTMWDYHGHIYYMEEIQL